MSLSSILTSMVGLFTCNSFVVFHCEQDEKSIVWRRKQNPLINIHLFVLVFIDDKRCCFLHRQQNMPIIMMTINMRKQLVTPMPIIIAVEFRVFKSRNANPSHIECYRLVDALLLTGWPSFISISCPQICRCFFEQIESFKYGKSLLIVHRTRLLSIGKHRSIEW
jgi:hypothetical protein